MEIKTTLILHLTPSEWPPSRKQTTNTRENIGKKEHLYAVGENVHWCRLYGNQYGDSLKILK
jgi:hypothetical protein